MASRNSSPAPEGRAGLGLALSRFVTFANAFDNWVPLGGAQTPGRAWTLGTASELYAASSLRPSDSASQVTISATDPLVESANLGSVSTSVNSVARQVHFGGLQPDQEGKETRRQMLERRRKECSAEEAEVALAPVLKINVPYCFYPSQYKVFRALFPRVNVDSGLHYTHHDHPVAHTATLVGLRYMQGLLRPGERVVDLNGNPNGNEMFNRFQQSRLRRRPNLPPPPIIRTMVEMRTAADAVRKVTKWGPQYDTTDGDIKERWFEAGMHDLEPGIATTFLSSHTLYYYSMYDVLKLLDKHRQSRLIALVNYSPEQSGKLYGELNYTKQGGITTQVSPNGEKYMHPDIDQWFQTNSFRALTDTIDSGISWTSTRIGGPLYVLTIVRCDRELARFQPYDPPAAPTLMTVEGRSILGVFRIGGREVRLRVTNHDFASELRQWMTFRDRNDPQTFVDLCVKARRMTSKDLVEGSRLYQVDDGNIQDHIVYAYLVDAPGENELLDGIRHVKEEVLAPLSEALKFEGVKKKVGWFGADPLYQCLFGPPLPKQALTACNKVAGKHNPKPVNSGGLMPSART